MRSDFEQKDGLVRGARADFRRDALDRVTVGKAYLQAIWRAAISIRLDNIWTFAETKKTGDIHRFLYFAESLSLTNIWIKIIAGLAQILCHLSLRIQLTLRDLSLRKSIDRCRSNVFGHASRIEGFPLSILREVVLPQSPCELRTLTGKRRHD
jgi:hypothetical protein